MRFLLSCLIVFTVAATEEDLNLLQIGSVKAYHATNHSTTRKRHKKVQKQCPSEPVEKNFGCNGQTQFHQNKGTRQCSFWGEPHISSIFGTKDGSSKIWHTIPGGSKEYSYETGLFRMARAVDKSWEIQVFSCGLIASAAVMRFGNTTIEVAMPPLEQEGGKPIFMVNGVAVPHGDLPGDLPDGSFLGPHHKVEFGKSAVYGRHGWFTWGSCADDPKGQVRVEITSSFRGDMGNIMNILIEAAEESYVDGPDEEKVSTCPGDSWLTAKKLDPSESLFRNPGNVCEGCKEVWRRYKGMRGGKTMQDVGLGQAMCNDATIFQKSPRAEELCADRGVSMDHAKEACARLSGKPIFFEDCVYDVCATGSDAAAENAEAEEEEEEPEPKCLQESADCDPKATCCDDAASRGLNFGNVVQNNLDGSGQGPRELRYGQVIDGVDLLITCPDYTSKRGNDANGVRGVLGSLSIDTGATQNLTFTFVQQGTTNPTSPGNAVISFMDLDQGKNNKQRESLKICGLGSPIVTSNSELETTFADSCTTATSTGRGTGKDNPDNPASMDDVQRARTIAFPLKGMSSFSAELSVTPKGRQGRLFLFTGHPTVACG